MNNSHKSITTRRVTILSVPIVILAVLMKVATGITRDILAALFGALVGVLITWIVVSPTRKVLRVLFIISFMALAAANAYFIFQFSREKSSPIYPRGDGLIADFTSITGGPARTATGTQISLLSDSGWNSHSKVWYERRDGEVGEPANGFLRVYFQLEPAYGGEPYVGISAPFSSMLTAYDISRFHKLTMKLRISDSSITNPPVVSIVLCSKNVSNADNAFPTWRVPSQDLRNQWVSLGIALTDFGRPHFVNYDVKLDPTQVYCMTIVIYGQPSRNSSGYIDVDDLRFE